MNIFEALKIMEQSASSATQKDALFAIKNYVIQHEPATLFHCQCGCTFLNAGIHSSNKLLAACPSCSNIIYKEIEI